MMIALAALKNWHITSLDVKTAFLYRELDEELYIEQLEGFKLNGQEHKVMHLKCAIYGLKQAALAWWMLPASLPHYGIGGPWPSERLNQMWEASRWFSMTRFESCDL